MYGRLNTVNPRVGRGAPTRCLVERRGRGLLVVWALWVIGFGLGAGCARAPGSTRPAVATAGTPGCRALAATGDTPLIDDFESSIGRILGNEGRGGWWFDFNDGTSGRFHRQRVDLSPHGASGQGLHVVASDFKTWGSGFGVNFHPASTRTHACPYDAGAASGIRVRARGQGRLRIQLVDIKGLSSSMGGACTRPAKLCYDLPGAWIDLEDAWKTYEIPFGDLSPEGWGGSNDGVDPAQLVGIHFRVGKRQKVEAWLDDLAFMGKATAVAPRPRPSKCPLEVMPRSARIAPAYSYAPLDDELTVHTFEQGTRSCGPLVRRYLSYVPKTLGARSGAPVLIFLHGRGGNAEAARTVLARDRFDALARRHGFVVIYGNAAPGVETSPNPRFTNTGAWRQAHLGDGQVDDVEYLSLTLADLKSRGVIAGDNPVLLVGLSNGGGMVLDAVRRLPDRWHGVAALMPFDGLAPSPIPDLTRSPLKRVLLAYTKNDPAMPPGYHEVMARQGARWAKALGIPDAAIAAPYTRPLPDVVVEGQSYRGDQAVALATRNSRASLIDVVGASVRAKVRSVALDHAGHFWPNPKGDTEDWILETYGFRNQDFDAADMVWDFLREAVGPR